MKTTQNLSKSNMSRANGPKQQNYEISHCALRTRFDRHSKCIRKSDPGKIFNFRDFYTIFPFRTCSVNTVWGGRKVRLRTTKQNPRDKTVISQKKHPSRDAGARLSRICNCKSIRIMFAAKRERLELFSFLYPPAQIRQPKNQHEETQTAAVFALLSYSISFGLACQSPQAKRWLEICDCSFCDVYAKLTCGKSTTES